MDIDPDRQWLRNKLRHIANEAAELPGVRLLSRPLYDRIFERPHRLGNTYRGVYASHADALRHAPDLLPSTYDIAPAAMMYGDRVDRITVSDYPLVYWLSRLFAKGASTVFDLGGHMGISYRGFRRYVDYPQELRWTVHDVPAVVAAGRALVAAHADLQQLSFADHADAADGQHVLVASGSLQYLDYTLAELLMRLRTRPRHVLVNLTPMHPRTSFFTLQNIGKAVLPYRVTCIDAFVSEMDAAGYEVLDHWKSHERSLRIPFAPAQSIDHYSGFCLRLREGLQQSDLQ